ncbi:hypothetical protein FH972_019803 [Carpinus fangiana]|uniref:Uncharacterized protein n=1 Tax=Carpinus fangiana TaxID=176857 RepID=A0A5N6RVM6_9ROSI|nr:hypothetical protein FH972_019803 [Carpinus fangiana]
MLVLMPLPAQGMLSPTGKRSRNSTNGAKKKAPQVKPQSQCALVNNITEILIKNLRNKTRSMPEMAESFVAIQELGINGITQRGLYLVANEGRYQVSCLPSLGLGFN